MSSPKKVLIVSRSFYPENSPRSFRTTELAKQLAKQGHSVTVITHKHSTHAAFEEKHRLVIKDLGSQKWKAITLKGSGLSLLLRRLIRRFSDLLFTYPDVELVGMVKRALKSEKNYDILISIAVPYSVHWGVAAVRSAKHPIARKWIADCGDPFMGLKTDTYRYPFYFEYVEKWFFRKVDYISITKIEMKQNYYKEFHSKIREIPQGFNITESSAYLKPYSPNGVPTFAFSGLFIRGTRDPSQLLQFLVSSDRDFRFHIFTESKAMVESYMPEARGRIVLHSYIPRERLLGVLSQMDFLVNITFDPGTQVPSKLIDYLIAGRPILNISSELDEANVDKFLNGDYSGKFTGLDLDSFRIENVAQRFLELDGHIEQSIKY